jgi:hypothetical protein
MDARRLHDVRGLYIAMNKACAMDRGEGRGDRDAYRNDLRDGEPPLGRDPPVERRARDILHREPHDAEGLIDRQRIEAHHARVLDLAKRARFFEDLLPERGARRAR